MEIRVVTMAMRMEMVLAQMADAVDEEAIFLTAVTGAQEA